MRQGYRFLDHLPAFLCGDCLIFVITKKIEECLKDLNLLCCRHKIRPVYYDNHCLKTDLDRYILETWRQESMNIHREAGKDKGKR